MLWKLIKQTICEVNHDRLLNQWQSDVLEGLVGWTFVDVVVPVSQVVEFDDEGVLDPVLAQQVSFWISEQGRENFTCSPSGGLSLPPETDLI